MAFVLQDVINEIEETRSLEPLKKFKKENLIKVAAHYGITPAIGATKSHILNLIKDHCVENDIIDEVEEKPIAETAEIVRLKLDFEREERRLAREAEKALQDAQFAEAQRAREEAQKAREAAEAEAQRARELRLAELKEARELRELELKAEQEKALLAAEIEAKKEAAAREHELRMADRKIHGKSTENVGLVSKVEPLKPISCGHCGKPGHIITNCWKLGGKTPCEHCGRFNHKSEDCRIAKNKLQKEVKPTGLTSLKGLKVSPFNESENSKGVKVKPLIDRNSFVEKNKGIKVNPLHNDKSCIEDEISPNTESDYMENYNPLISEGVVSLVGDENSSQKVKILRDTGTTLMSLMLDSVLPLTENSFTGANVLISGVEMGVLEVPLHEVNIKSSLINGNIVIGMRPSLPVEGISLILGNDLAGEKVMVDPRVVEKPRDDENTERLAEKFPGIFPASVVTRSMKAKKEAIKEQGKEEIGLSGTFLENIDVKFEERNKEKADKALMRNESRNVKENIPEKQESESKLVISRQNLIVEQSKDKELLDLFKIALTPVEAEKVSVGYLIKDDILLRKWSPTACDNNEKGETVYQIVVPTVHRREVLELAHDLPVSVVLTI